MQTPTIAAYLALALWPFFSIALFRRLPADKALISIVLGGYLFLPSGVSVKLPMIPAIDKYTVASISAALGCALLKRSVDRSPKHFPYGLTELLIAALCLGPVITSVLNTDPIVQGHVFLPGVGLYDGISAAVREFLLFLPFMLGRQYLNSVKSLASVIRMTAYLGIAYSLPALFEIRMSPQLNEWIYGVYSSGFITTIRDGGFRPVVFLENGLLLSLFMMSAFVCSGALMRRGELGRLVPLYLGAVLVMSKSLGALLYGAFMFPLCAFLRPKMQINAAAALVIFALVYPALRMADLFPTNWLVTLAETASPERAQSLDFRFKNEDTLLAHARERFIFGWGRFGRNRIFDPDTGRDISVTDGEWIIQLGSYGLIGFLAEFGLFSLVVLYSARTLKLIRNVQDASLVATLALLIAINLIDSLPNASITPWSWLLAGSLLGASERQRRNSIYAEQFVHQRAHPSHTLENQVVPQHF